MSARTISFANVDRALDLLLVGRLGLHQVPAQLCSWYWAGMADGRAEQAEHVRFLERQITALEGWLAEADMAALDRPTPAHDGPDPAAAWPRPITREVFA